MSTTAGIQGQLLEVTVVGCYKLKDTEWISRQDPYVCLEYANTKFRTRTCTDGGKNPIFQEKFVFSLIEGLREFNVIVWNSNTLTYDDFIGSGRVQLQKVLAQGYDDTAWSLQTKSGRYAGEVRLVMHFANATHKAGQGNTPSAPPYVAPQYSQSPAFAASYPPPTTTYPAPSPYPSYAPPSIPNPAAYPQYPYPPPPQQPAAHPYPSQPYSPAPYPPAPYPPPQSYPPPPQAAPFYPPAAPYPGTYPPPPYY
ncbi:calcium-dependent lipid-binding (CaLB domain) family protein [Tasmannia lanceolata]|uniref:calcium-dependent lipid-binding (CaLB domain) family protein n=1 Tax=Tasmannia lanceolata TaxID=3420 RepID=UPI004063DD0D